MVAVVILISGDYVLSAIVPADRTFGILLGKFVHMTSMAAMYTHVMQNSYEVPVFWKSLCIKESLRIICSLGGNVSYKSKSLFMRSSVPLPLSTARTKLSTATAFSASIDVTGGASCLCLVRQSLLVSAHEQRSSAAKLSYVMMMFSVSKKPKLQNIPDARECRHDDRPRISARFHRVRHHAICPKANARCSIRSFRGVRSFGRRVHDHVWSSPSTGGPDSIVSALISA